MAELKRLQSQHAELFKQLDNKVVKQNNDKDHARYLNLLNVNAPDPETTTLLRDQADNWFANPLAFCDRPMQKASNFGNLSHLSPRAQLAGCYIQAGSDSA